MIPNLPDEIPVSSVRMVQVNEDSCVTNADDAGYSGMPSINSMAPSLPTVMMTSPSVLVKNPASEYAK